MKYTKLLLISFILFLVIIGCFFTIKLLIESKIYEGYATVNKIISFNKVDVRITDNENNKIGNAIINSGIFKIGDEVKVTYSKKGKGYNIKSIELMTKNKNSNAKLYTNIKKSITMLSYRDSFTIKAVPKDQKYDENILNFMTIPIKINKQEYKLLNTNEWFEAEKCSFKKYDCISLSSTTLIYDKGDINIKIDQPFQVISLDLIKEENKMEIDYQIKNQEVNFEFNEHGKYSLVVEFDNEDIINYLIVL